MTSIKITKSSIEKIDFAPVQMFYRDTELKGFALRVGATSKTFIVEKKINGKATRVTIGSYPGVSVEQARKIAQETLSKMITHQFTSPTKEVKPTVTLSEAYDTFKSVRDLKPKTIRVYDNVIRVSYQDWMNLGVSDITGEMIMNRHSELSNQRGKPAANSAGRTLRSVINFSIAKYDLNIANPFLKLTQTRQWNKAKRRTGHLKQSDFATLLSALDTLSNPIVADYIKFTLFTGCRLQESASLAWSDIDFNNRCFIIKDPKNSNPIELPLSTEIEAILRRRHAAKTNNFVFPAKSKSGHIEEPKKTFYYLSDILGKKLRAHDLRRTFVTIADSLDISHYTLKALVNHSLSGSDVTGGYIQMSVERLREPMQKITDFILNNANK